MLRRLVTALGLALLIGLAALAQDKLKDDIDKFREGMRKPDTALDHWNALTFEMDVGRLDLAAAHLKSLVSLPAAKRGKELLKIVEQDGMPEVLKLRNVPAWSKDAKVDKEAKANVAKLIQEITDATRAELKNEGAIRDLVRQLQATKEERTYALRELAKLGATAVPTLVQAHLDSPKAARPAEQRQAVVRALEQLGPATVPPLLAALDSDNTALKLDILDVLRKRHARSGRYIVPHLWFPSASPKQPQAVRDKAKKLLAYLEEVPESKLPTAKTALVAEAERYYKGDRPANDPAGNTVWRWDGKRLVEGWPAAPPKEKKDKKDEDKEDKVDRPVATPADQATAYYGLRFARQALTLDPTYRPAQVVGLSLALDKATPGIAEVVAKADADLLLEVLDRGLKDKRVNLILPVIRALGDRAEVKAKRPLKRGDPGLVRALYYPDARVQLAAAEALLRIPGAPPAKTTNRIIEVLRNALSPVATMVPGRKVLVAVADEDWRNKVADAVLASGATPVSVTNGKDALRRLKGSTEYEAVLMSSDLPHPGLAYTLAQVHADRDVSRVPIYIAAVPTTRAGFESARRFEILRKRRNSINADTVNYRAELRQIDRDEQAAKAEVQADRTMKSEERYQAIERVNAKYSKARTEAGDRHRGEVRLLAQLPSVEAEIVKETRRYDLEVQQREGALSRFLTRYPGTSVVHASLLTDGKALGGALAGAAKTTVGMTAQERTSAAEKAIELLADLAAGKPKGYDVRPAATAILDTLRNGRLSPDGQLAAIQAASHLSGARPQQELAAVVRAEARGAQLRAAAASALLRNIQRQGRQLTRTEIAAVQSVGNEKAVDAKLKDLIDKLTGALQNDATKTGERLRDYEYKPGK